jgi:hypothetical protein
MNGVHSVLPALNKGSELVAALDEKLRGERRLAIRQVPPQPVAACVNSLSKNALSHGVIASSPTFAPKAGEYGL